jgi:hypothetical protein
MGGVLRDRSLDASALKALGTPVDIANKWHVKPNTTITPPTA